MTLRIGTRGSALALAQTGHVADALTAATGEDVEIVTVTTQGDTSRESLSTIGGTGVFVNALRDALLDGACDLIVHSLKDLPTAPAEGFTIAAMPMREDPRDALCASDDRSLDEHQQRLRERSFLAMARAATVLTLLAWAGAVTVVATTEHVMPALYLGFLLWFASGLLAYWHLAWTAPDEPADLDD